jgi:hypothetical protein
MPQSTSASLSALPAANLAKALTRISIAALLLIISGLSSCASGSTGPDFSEGGFSVDARPGYLRLTNESSARVHYVALEAETATRVDLIFDPEQWPSVPPHGEQEIPNAELMGCDSARQAVVYWWTNGEYGTTVVVDLR